LKINCHVEKFVENFPVFVDFDFIQSQKFAARNPFKLKVCTMETTPFKWKIGGSILMAHNKYLIVVHRNRINQFAGVDHKKALPPKRGLQHDNIRFLVGLNEICYCNGCELVFWETKDKFTSVSITATHDICTPLGMLTWKKYVILAVPTFSHKMKFTAWSQGGLVLYSWLVG